MLVFYLAFILVYAYSQVFLLNLITPWTLLKTNSWFAPCFKFIMRITSSVLSPFRFFQFSFFEIKVVNHYKVNVIFQDFEENTKKISFITFFVIDFYEVFINLRSIIDPLKTFYRKLLQHCPTIYIIYIPIF